MKQIPLAIQILDEISLKLRLSSSSSLDLAYLLVLKALLYFQMGML